MNKSIHAVFAAARSAPAAALLALTTLYSLHAAAQMPPADVEKMVKYAQCIRANGYPEFPDPAPDGRMRLQLDAKSTGKFEAAQAACKDKMPPGLAAANQEITPDRLQALLGFAQCVRGKGVSGFPDPTSKGVFELSGALDISTPQAQEALKACRGSNAIGMLMFRKTAPR